MKEDFIIGKARRDIDVGETILEINVGTGEISSENIDINPDLRTECLLTYLFGAPE